MNRKILYGYQIQDGKLIIQPQEAEVVKRIFSTYLEGTYQWKIADILNADSVLYRQERPQWTMHRVGFILKNPRYTGADGYPVLIDAGTFQAAQEIIQKRKKTVRRSDRPALRYREKLRCGECGSPLKRRHSGQKRNDTLYLQCEGCGIRTEIKDIDFLAEVERQTAAYTPSEQSAVVYEPSAEAVRLTNAINRGLERPDQPEEIVKMILQGVSARYDCFPQEANLIDIHGEKAIQYIAISADNAVTATFKG
nr:recombinase family protein [uncultured Oscillibacter sp.]